MERENQTSLIRIGFEMVFQAALPNVAEHRDLFGHTALNSIRRYHRAYYAIHCHSQTRPFYGAVGTLPD